MNSERIKEIQEATGYPDSVSVQQALLKVWNECAQEYKGVIKEAAWKEMSTDQIKNIVNNDSYSRDEIVELVNREISNLESMIDRVNNSA